MAKRLTTGLSGLDAQLGGGIPAGTVHVLLGEPMNAQELFTYHFAAGSKPGKCQFVTTAATEARITDGVRAVGGDPAKGKITVERLSGKARMPDATADRYIVDNFSEHMQAVGWDAAYARLRELREKTWQGEQVLLITATPDLHDAKQLAMLRMWGDGVLELGFDRQGFGLYPYLKVTKMRGVPDSARFLLFKETEKGLFMESTRRVF